VDGTCAIGRKALPGTAWLKYLYGTAERSTSWQFNWKTPKTHAGKCRVPAIADGSTHIAEFLFE
jgi:hypothetical protein